jgi:Fe-coproporphyrin III synthase
LQGFGKGPLENPGQRRYGPTGRKILQIHPTLRCNLECLHCYSSSGPQERGDLDLGLVLTLVSDAARLGYERLSISGGEPLLYTGLAEILRRARASGMHTSVTTNGFFLNARHMDPLVEHLDALAISVDGPPDIHNAMRGSPRAFDKLSAGLNYARGANIPFGLIHTVTRESWIHLLWLTEFAVASGAGLLQLHPLELAGRAERVFEGREVTGDLLCKVYILCTALAIKYVDTLLIQTDLLHRDNVLQDPAMVYAGNTSGAPGTKFTGPGVLVLEPDGTVVPMTYGFSRRYQVCNVKSKTLAAAWPAFLANMARPLDDLCHSVFESVVASDAEVLFNWHERICAQSHVTRDNSLL